MNNNRVALIGLAVIVLVAGIIIADKNDSAESDILKNIKTKKPPEVLKIGFITDAHCYANDEEENGEVTWILNWRCTQPLEAFVKKMNNEFHPDFVIQNGDLIDGKDKRGLDDFVEIKEFYDTLDAPHYHVNGNHEMRDFERSKWLEITGYEKSYYSFDVKGYRIIVLDGNNKPGGGGFVETGPEVEFYPGAIDDEQMEWLEKTLKDVDDLIKIVFVHQPPVATDAKELKKLFWNGAELQALFQKYNVVTTFSGHVERTCQIKEGGIQYNILPGFWKENGGLLKEYQRKNQGVFSEITIEGDKVDIKLYFRAGKNQPYQFEELTAENTNCKDGKTLD